MSKIVMSFLFFIMLLGIMKNSVLFFVYRYERAFFIEMFCENKNRPQLKCDGKCRLAEMMKEEREEDAAKVLKQLQLEAFYFVQLKDGAVPETDDYVEAAVYTSFYQQLYSFLYIAESKKPPEYATVG